MFPQQKVPLSIYVIFCKSDIYSVALFWKMICNLRNPMSLRHPVHVPPTKKVEREF